MFYSGVSASELIAELQEEIDVSSENPIKNSQYVNWLNSLEQLLYTEIIKEQSLLEIEDLTSPIDLKLVKNTDEAFIRFEDIYKVYASGKELTKTTVNGSLMFDDCYYKLSNKVGFKTATATQIHIIYFVRPELKNFEGENVGENEVMLPYEFLDLARAKLRGEAYKLANQDDVSAKWLNDYNALLEIFKVWVEDKRASFGQ